MRRFFLTVVAGVLISNACEAAPITVRSGEHGSFSRLVFSLPEGVGGWEFKETETGYSVSLEDQTARFRTKEVFRRIDRNRLIDLRSSNTEGRLDLVLGCACTAKTFSLNDGLLVIDIHDPPSSEQSTDVETLEVVKVAENFSSEKPGMSSQENRDSRSPERVPDGPVLDLNLTSPNPNKPIPSYSPELTDSNPTEILEKSSRRARAQERLLEQLARAASQGFLEPVKPFLANHEKVRGNSESVETPNFQGDEPSSEPKLFVTSNAEKAPNINVSSNAGLRQENLTFFEQVLPVGLETKCPDDSYFAIENWSQNTSLAKQIGYWRSKFFNEAGKVNTEAATNLTRLYLHFGFGAEALRVLDLASSETKENRIARVLARAVDGLPPAIASELDGLMYCDNRAALWALLSAKTVLPSDSVNIDSVLAAFSALPIHLRRHLGPNASGKLLDHGNKAAAQSVLTFVHRGPQEQGPRLVLAEAQIELSNGATTRAREIFETAATVDSDISPEALISLVRMHATENLFIEEHIASLAAAFALEHRHGAIGPELRRTAVVARALARQFNAAYKALVEIEKRDGHQAALDIRSGLFAILSQNGGDIAFLTLTLGHLNELSETVDINTSNDIGKRLLNLGFPGEAGILLKGSAKGKTGRERRLLRSRAALAQSKPRNAEAELLGLNGKDVDLLRAQARAQSGDYGIAQSLYTSLNKPDEALHSAWMSSDWKTLSLSSDQIYSAIAVVVSDTEMPRDNEQMDQTEDVLVLAKNRALLQESVASRDLLSGLLNKHEIPDETEK